MFPAVSVLSSLSRHADVPRTPHGPLWALGPEVIMIGWLAETSLFFKRILVPTAAA